MSAAQEKSLAQQIEQNMISAYQSGDIESAKVLSSELQRLMAHAAKREEQSPNADQRAQQSQPVARSWSDIVTGSDRIAENPELGELPEFGTTSEGDTFKVALGMLSTFDPQAQIEMIKEQVPGVNIQNVNGEFVIEAPTEEGGMRRSVLNRPGISPQDLTTTAAQLLSFVPAAKVATLGRNLWQRIVLGAGASGATEQLMQEGGIALGREQRDPTSTAISAALGGVGEIPGPLIANIRARRAFKRAGADKTLGAKPNDLTAAAPSMREADDVTAATGVEFSKPQQTGLRSMLERQSFVSDLPTGAQRAMRFLEKQNVQTRDAVNDFMARIAPATSVETGSTKLRSAAQKAIANRKMIRSQTASPIYKQAFRRQRKEQNPLINTDKLQERLKGTISQFDPTTKTAVDLNKVLRPVMSAEGDIAKLHNAKIEIDGLLNAYGDNAMSNTTKRFVAAVQKDLVDTMVAQSPSYRAAKSEFSRLSPEVDRISDSILGKIANFDDTQLKNVTSRLFDPQDTNPQVVKAAREAINEVDPSAWNEIVRNEFEKRLGSVRSEIIEGSIDNLPGKMKSAIVGNDKSREVILNALDPDQRRAFTYLENAMTRASKGRPGGSPTATREEIKRELRGGWLSGIRNWLRQPVDTAAGVGEDALFDRRVKIISEALFDPAWKGEMLSIAKINPNTPASARAMLQLLNDIETTSNISFEDQDR